MQLVLLRHGKAEDHGHPSGDGARALVEKGREQVKAAAFLLDGADLLPDLVLTSPVRRALETAEVFCAMAGLPGPMVQGWLACGMSPEVAAAELAAFRDFPRVAIVGHEPDLSGLASWLLESPGHAVEMRKGALACIECRPPVRGGRLIYLIPPKLAKAASAG
jgi:phosphohistidine phosphatase